MFGQAKETRREAAKAAPLAAKGKWSRNGGVYIGRTVEPPDDPAHLLRGAPRETGRSTVYADDRHLLTIGPNGSGKSRRVLIPNLYHLRDWSIVAIDPKGELFAATALHRAKAESHRIKLIDPFGVVKENYPALAARIKVESDGFNPLASLDPASPRFVDHAKNLAMALIRTDGTKEVHFPQGAQALVKGLLMALRLRLGKDATLGHLRKVLGRTPKDLAEWSAAQIAEFGSQSPALAAALGEFAEYTPEDREIGGMRRTAKVQTDWLDSPEMQADLGGADFDFGTLKATPTTVYLVLPPDYLVSHGTWLRLMVTSILRPLLRSTEESAAPVPVLFMLDEFAQLGKMEIIENNYALMRGYGVKLWTIWQDLNQAKDLYSERWETFISNAGITQSFAPQDLTTRKYLSDLAGTRLVWHRRKAESGGLAVSGGGVSFNSGDSASDSAQNEPLMYPYELGAMAQGESVIFTQRGDVRRVLFPDATALEGVADMMAEARRLSKP